MITKTQAVVVVPDGEPIYSYKATKVELSDNPSGDLVVLVSQPNDHYVADIAIRVEEWPVIRRAINKMVRSIS